MSDPAAVGTRYGFRTIVGPAPNSPSGNRRLRVRCDCGRYGTARLSDMLDGRSLTCRECARANKPRPPQPFRYCRNTTARRPCDVSRCALYLDHHDHSCALDVAAEGPHSCQEIANLLGCTRERVRQIEAQALRKLGRRGDTYRMWVLGFEHGRPGFDGCRMVPRRRS
jgi:hypothetical protein